MTIPLTFAETEARFRRLKAQYDAGDLSQTDYTARLRNLMVADGEGRWWMLGVETGQWYVHDGEKWVPAEPPLDAKRPPEPGASLPQEASAEPLGQGSAVPGGAVEAAHLPEAGQPEAPGEDAGAAKQRPNAPQPATPAHREPTPAAPARKPPGWAVALIVGIMAVILFVIFRSCAGNGTEPAARLWANRDVIRPGECIIVLWKVPGAEHVRIMGPSFDVQDLLPGSGEKEACLKETAAFELQSPDRKRLAAMTIRVRE
jgi:hypothetical protein